MSDLSKLILFTDMDGTLLDRSKNISDRVRNALSGFVSRGNLLVMSTGRPLTSVLETTERIRIRELVSYIVAYNGSLTYSLKSESPIAEHKVSLTDAAVIIDECHKRDIHIQSYLNETILAEAKDEQLIMYKKSIHMPHRIVGDLHNALTDAPYKLLAITPTRKDALLEIQEVVSTKTEGRIAPTFSNDFLLEFYTSDSGKGAGILDLCSYLKLPTANTYAIGDECNDISMFEVAGCSFAMKGSRPEVIQAANYVTDHSNDEDGILDLINRFY